jgi:hypothetical protein
MKKLYFLLSLTAASFALKAQGVKIPLNADFAVPMKKGTSKVYQDLPGNGGNSAGAKINSRGVSYTNFIKIGTSYYDLQSNYAMPHRLLVHPNGSVSATWTTSANDFAGFPLRGSGYNYRNVDMANKWLTPDSNRVELNDRTGWPNIGILRDGSEFVIGHEANQGGFVITKNNGSGTRPSVSTKILSEPPYKPIWARTANSGDTIHLVCSYTDSALAGEKRAPRRKGIFAPMVYSRSVDAGVTWDIAHQMLPDYDSTLTNNGGSDQYAIDAMDSIVAIVNADRFQGVVLWKSTDAGTTFKRTIVDTFPYAPYVTSEAMLDTVITNDGTCDVIIDKNGKVHVFWGIGRIGDNDTTDESILDFFGEQGIGYWNENIGVGKSIVDPLAFDRDGDNEIRLDAATFYRLDATGNLPKLSNGTSLSHCARLTTTNPMRQPNVAMDDSGYLYCVFSVPIEGDIYDLGANYRDIAVVSSKDGGLTWSTPQDLTQVLTREEDFPSVARRANGFLHLMWQQDAIPGNNLSNNNGNAQNHPVVLNDIMYQAIPVKDILENKIGMIWGVNVDKPNTGEVMLVNQNYPNPFTGISNVMVWMSAPGDIKLEVHNIAGMLVHSHTFSGLNRGNHILPIDASGLAAGVYTYSLISGGSKVSRTMMVH